MQDEFNHYFKKAHEESHRNPLYMPKHGPYRPEPDERYNGGGNTPPLELSDDDGDDMFSDDETKEEESEVMINHVYAPSYRRLFVRDRGIVPRLLLIGDTCDSYRYRDRYMPYDPVRRDHKYSSAFNNSLLRNFRRALRSFQELLYDEFYPASKAFLPSRIRHVEDVVWIGDDLFTGYSSYLYYWECREYDKRFVLKRKAMSDIIKHTVYIQHSGSELMLHDIIHAMNVLKQNISYISRNHINDREHRILDQQQKQIHQKCLYISTYIRNNRRYRSIGNMKNKRRRDSQGDRDHKRRRHHIYENQELKF